jgi:DNA-binding transcriptional LysR family regulator
VSSPVGLAHEILPAVISNFLEKFPQVQLEVVLVNRRVDLVTEGVDVALRVREPGDEDPLLVTRRLRQAQMLLVASPTLLGREINRPDDLKDLPVLGALEPIGWCTSAWSIARAKATIWQWKRAWASTTSSCARPAPSPGRGLPRCR